MGLLDKVKKAASDAVHKDNDEQPDAELQARNKKIEDVLEILQIPATFEVPAEIFLPEDLKTVEFDIQVPHGYDEGQVMRFVSQSRQTIKFFTDLLRKRNEDVAKLASVIDKLQVDANNLRFENEIANGISVIPTMDDADLETQLMEVKLQNRNLEDQVRSLKANATASGLPTPAGGIDKQTYEAVLDELSIARRKNEALEEENLTIKSRLAYLDDDADDELGDETLREKPLSTNEYQRLGVSIPDSEPLDELPEPELELPRASDSLPDSGFGFKLDLIEDDPEDLPELYEGDHDGDPRTLSALDYDEDDDDTLDELMKNLRG